MLLRRVNYELDTAKLSLPAKWRDIQDLSYLDAVIREGLRINPGIAMILERVVPPSGFTLPDGRFVPSGTAIGINPAVTNRDIDVFGDDAELFNPDRWLKKNGEKEGVFRDRFKRMKDVADFVFGGGNRLCMGRDLAMLEIYKLFATLYSLFDVSIRSPSSMDSYMNKKERIDEIYRSNLLTTITCGSIIMLGLFTSMIFQ